MGGRTSGPSVYASDFDFSPCLSPRVASVELLHPSARVVPGTHRSGSVPRTSPRVHRGHGVRRPEALSADGSRGDRNGGAGGTTTTGTLKGPVTHTHPTRSRHPGSPRTGRPVRLGVGLTQPGPRRVSDNVGRHEGPTREGVGTVLGAREEGDHPRDARLRGTPPLRVDALGTLEVGRTGL